MHAATEGAPGRVGGRGTWRMQLHASTADRPAGCQRRRWAEALANAARACSISGGTAGRRGSWM